MSQKANQMIKHSGIYAFANMSKQAIGFIMLPIYTRYLTPADYGIVGILTVSLSLVDIFLGARLTQAIPKFYHGEENDARKNTVISTALIITVGISTATFIALLYFSEISSTIMFGKPDYSQIVAIYSTLILTQVIENYGLLYIRIIQKPFLFLTFSLSKLFLQLGMNIWLIVYLEMGVLGVVVTSASSSILIALILLGYTLSKTKISWSSEIAKRMVIFSWPLWLAAFATLYTTLASRYTMRIFGSLDDVGIYELAARFQLIIVLLIWQPINQYWQTERFKYYTPNSPASGVFQSVFLSISTILVLAIATISVLSDPIIKIMATSAYHGAITIIPILCLSALFMCLSGYLNFSMMATDNTKWISRNNFFIALIATIFILVLIPRYGYLGAAIATILTLLIQFLLTARKSKQFFDMRLQFFPLFLMVAVAVLTYILSNHSITFSNFLVDTLFKLALLMVAYICIGLIMWHYSEDKEMFRTFFSKLKARLKTT